MFDERHDTSWTLHVKWALVAKWTKVLVVQSYVPQLCQDPLILNSSPKCFVLGPGKTWDHSYRQFVMYDSGHFFKTSIRRLSDRQMVEVINTDITTASFDMRKSGERYSTLPGLALPGASVLPMHY